MVMAMLKKSKTRANIAPNDVNRPTLEKNSKKKPNNHSDTETGTLSKDM